MTDRLVCDASAVVAVLLEGGDAGRAAASRFSTSHLAAPTLVVFEVANILRRHEHAALISADVAAQAHTDLIDLEIELWPYDVFAARAWELRRNLTTYDASYVALAELLDAPLLTLDRRIGRAPGIRCVVEDL